MVIMLMENAERGVTFDKLTRPSFGPAKLSAPEIVVIF